MNRPVFRTTTYRFPRTGRVQKQVVIDSGGGIRVRRGDTLIGYSIAIHNGDARKANEFGIYKRHLGRIVQLGPFDSVTPGSVIVHIPSCREGKQDVPNLKPISREDYQKLLKMFCVEMSVPMSASDVISGAAKFISAARLSALFVELAGKFEVGAVGYRSLVLARTATQLGLSTTYVGGSVAMGHIFVGLQLCAPILPLIASAMRVQSASGAGVELTKKVGWAYGMTAAVFRPRYRPAISKKLDDRIAKQRPQEHLDHVLGWQEGVKLAVEKDAPRFQAKSKLPADLYRLLIRGAFKNQPHRYCYFIMQLMAAKLPAQQAKHIRTYSKTGVLFNH